METRFTPDDGHYKDLEYLIENKEVKLNTLKVIFSFNDDYQSSLLNYDGLFKSGFIKLKEYEESNGEKFYTWNLSQTFMIDKYKILDDKSIILYSEGQIDIQKFDKKEEK